MKPANKIPANKKINFIHIIFLMILLITPVSCSKKPENNVNSLEASMKTNTGDPAITSAGETKDQKEDFIEDFWSETFSKAGLPDFLKNKILSYLLQGPDFAMELFSLMDADPYLTLLVDKQHALDGNYVPNDLIELTELTELTDNAYRVSRAGLMLRRAAAESLQRMAEAAKDDGVILEAASAYRSFDYQAEVYSRNVRELGQQAADRESAKPGHSQHQLGLVIDFYPIDDMFAETPASRWLRKNAAQFGWSLSYPEGFEEITGYRHESWHYRYLGIDLANFTEKYFDGIQQYALLFIFAWKNFQ